MPITDDRGVFWIEYHETPQGISWLSAHLTEFYFFRRDVHTTLSEEARSYIQEEMLSRAPEFLHRPATPQLVATLLAVLQSILTKCGEIYDFTFTTRQLQEIEVKWTFRF